MKFKQLEIKQEGGWFKNILSNHLQKSILFIVLGSLAGMLFFYLTEGISMDHIATGSMVKSALGGAFLGFFITNSPCARNKC